VLPPCVPIIRKRAAKPDRAQLEEPLTALLNLSNRPAISLRIVASLENCSVTVETRSSSSRFASAKIFTRPARSPLLSPASRRSILATSESWVS